MTTNELQELEKIRRKVPNWLKKDKQICSRILIGFLKYKNATGNISVDRLKKEFDSIEKFKENLDSMCIISAKNHAKVFERNGNEIKFWPPAADFIEQEYVKYCKNGKGKDLNSTEKFSKIDIENIEQVRKFFLLYLSAKSSESYLTYLRNAAKDLGVSKVSPDNFFPLEKVLEELISCSDDKKRFSNCQSAIILYNKYLQSSPGLLPKVDPNIISSWKKYFEKFKELSELLGGSSNIQGTLAERLCAEYYDAKLQNASTAGTDLIDSNELLYQVKARVVYPDKKRGAPLSAFRSNKEKEEITCHFLIVVLFSKLDGSLLQVLEYDLSALDISPFKKFRKFQNAEIITFSKKFEQLGKDITKDFIKKVQWL